MISPNPYDILEVSSNLEAANMPPSWQIGADK